MSPESETAYRIRKCKFEDLDHVLQIEKVSFPNPYDRRLFSYFLTAEPDGFWVAQREGRIVGYAIATAQRDSGLIASVAVASELRRRGIGTMLMRTALDWLANKVKRVKLQVSVNNQTAIDFYRRFSFREIGLIKSYYPNGDDAILMSREI